jgi:DNA-binding HxlR family transcriptional regulator
MTTRETTSERTYGQWCPVAAGLDVLGDRWVLLICRELLIGDRRFTDLRVALPGLAPNLLTERLRSLQAAGLVETADLPPPAARTVYRLTAEGQEVTPVLRALARFGVHHLDGEPSETFDARRAAHALLLPWRARIDVNLRVRLVLNNVSTGAATSVDIVLDGTESQVLEPQGIADVTITTNAVALADVRRDPAAGLSAQVAGTSANRRGALAAFGLQLAN